MSPLSVVARAFALTALAAVIGIATNLVRADGIPLIAEVPYEIFAPCRDSEADAQSASASELTAAGPSEVVYVDARPAEAFDEAHVEGAVNVPYSPLFGAAKKDVAVLKDTVARTPGTSVIVYGSYEDPAAPGSAVDFAEPLAQQLVEAGLENVKHTQDDLETLNKKGVATVQKDGKKP